MPTRANLTINPVSPRTPGQTVVDGSLDPGLYSITQQERSALLATSNGVSVLTTSDNIYVNQFIQSNGQQFTQQTINRPGGSNNAIQFNSNNNLGGSNNLLFNPVDNLLTVNANVDFTNSMIDGGTFTNISISSANISAINNGNSNVFVNPNSNVTIHVADANGNAVSQSILTVTRESNASILANNANATLTVTANTNLANSFTSNNYVLGNATNVVSTQRWLAASSANTTMNQVLYDIGSNIANTVSSLDFHITATSYDGNNLPDNRQVSKILAVNLGNNISYTEYGGMWVGTQVADLAVSQNMTGNIQLTTSPLLSANVQYKIILTTYNN